MKSMTRLASVVFAVVLTTALTVATLVTPTSVYAHSLNGSISGRYTRYVERFRPEITKQLKIQGVYSKARVNRILNIIKHESGGHFYSRNGSCVGVLQFNSSWKHNYSRSYFKRHHIRGTYHSDNRLNPFWCIRRIAIVYRQGGTSKVQDKWCQTYWR